MDRSVGGPFCLVKECIAAESEAIPYVFRTKRASPAVDLFTQTRFPAPFLRSQHRDKPQASASHSGAGQAPPVS